VTLRTTKHGQLTPHLDNQWPVDFNLSLCSFEPQIAGVSNIIALSASSPNAPPIFFTSSIGTVSRWPYTHPHEHVPETILTDPSLPGEQGYSKSKWIAEKLLEAASQKSGVSGAICRIGQIAGPVETSKSGAWNKHEWLPSVR
jgi:thioester reductase-like protein